jgi:hypothetical protein
LSARHSSCVCLALIDLASAGKQTDSGSNVRERAWRYLVFRFLEGERMKGADGAWGEAATVDRKKVAKTAMTLNLNSTLALFPFIFRLRAWLLDAKCHWPFSPLL